MTKIYNIIKSQIGLCNTNEQLDAIYNEMQNDLSKLNMDEWTNLLDLFIERREQINNDIPENELNALINDDEIIENKNDFCVTLMYETPEMIIAQKHIMNCDRATANCYKRHFDKLNGHLWNDWKNSGLYCLVVSRIWCTNHMDFERDNNVNQINGFYKM